VAKEVQVRYDPHAPPIVEEETSNASMKLTLLKHGSKTPPVGAFV
jgi:hypothetical protein